MEPKGCPKWNWMSWLSVILRRLRKNDIEGAANTLANCLGEPEDATDEEWMKKMYGHNELKGFHKQLWDLMQPLVEDGDRDATEKMLREKYAWSI